MIYAQRRRRRVAALVTGTAFLLVGGGADRNDHTPALAAESGAADKGSQALVSTAT